MFLGRTPGEQKSNTGLTEHRDLLVHPYHLHILLIQRKALRADRDIGTQPVRN